MPIKMAKHAKANVASNALRECLEEEKELIFYIVSFVVKKFTERIFRDQQKSLLSPLFSVLVRLVVVVSNLIMSSE